MEVSVRELKNRLSEYLRRVSAGEEVTVTSHKRAVAKLVPPGRLRGIGEKESPDYTRKALTERLQSLPWVRWSAGGKPRLRAGITPKRGGHGKKTLAESLLDDRR